MSTFYPRIPPRIRLWRSHHLLSDSKHTLGLQDELVSTLTDESNFIFSRLAITASVFFSFIPT